MASFQSSRAARAAFVRLTLTFTGICGQASGGDFR